MFNTSFRIVKEDALAEDIMQESFLAAFEKLDQYKAEVSFGAWLKKIVINKSIAEYRKRSKKIGFLLMNPEFKSLLTINLEKITPIKQSGSTLR